MTAPPFSHTTLPPEFRAPFMATVASIAEGIADEAMLLGPTVPGLPIEQDQAAIAAFRGAIVEMIGRLGNLAIEKGFDDHDLLLEIAKTIIDRAHERLSYGLQNIQAGGRA